MPDPLRTDAPDLDRDAKIEQLLLAGLDHYFAAQYDQAINVWTRALFLDRSHARARAYIERARSALAERQRKSEELLHHGMAAFDRGESGEARRLLAAAVDHGAPPDKALVVLDRLNRLEQSASTQPDASVPRGGVARVFPSVADAATRSRFGSAVWVIVAVAIAGAGVIAWPRVSEWWSTLSLQPLDVAGERSLDFARDRPAPAPVPVALPTERSLPIPLRGETALAQAKALAASGHVRDALKALDLVRSTDPQRPEADRLRADLQRQLIGLSTAPPGSLP